MFHSPSYFALAPYADDLPVTCSKVHGIELVELEFCRIALTSLYLLLEILLHFIIIERFALNFGSSQTEKPHFKGWVDNTGVGKARWRTECLRLP